MPRPEGLQLLPDITQANQPPEVVDSSVLTSPDKQTKCFIY